MQNTELKTILKGEHIGRIGISQTNWMRYVDKNLSDEKYLEENIHLVFEVGTGIDTQDFSLDHHFPFINHSNLNGKPCMFCGEEAERGTTCDYFSRSNVSLIREELKRILEQRLETLDKLMNK